jgi:hypothetical protein
LVLCLDALDRLSGGTPAWRQRTQLLECVEVVFSEVHDHI